MEVDRKTTGFLYSEYFTTEMKAKHAKDEDQKKEVVTRLNLLHNVINRRLSDRKLIDAEFNEEHLINLTSELRDTLQECWTQQDIVMDGTDPEDVFKAVRRVLLANKHRNKLIGEIDAMFGDKYFRWLEKTYG